MSYLQALYVLPQQTSIRGTNSRLFFLVGGRVLSALNSNHNIVRNTSVELSCPATEILEKVSALQINTRDGGRREKKLREEVAGFLAKDLWNNSNVTTKENEGEIRRAVLLREEDSTNSLEFLSLISFAIKTKWEEYQVENKNSKVLFALASGSKESIGGSLIIFGTEDLVMKASKEMIIEFGSRIKGGGKGRWQGKLAGKWEKDDSNLLSKVLEKACSV